MNEPKNCLNCGHRIPPQMGFGDFMSDYCSLTGLKCHEQRQAATQKSASLAALLCDAFFSGWMPQPNLWEWIRMWWRQ
jgi:hypothetical protein